jgi:hypothetical protein
MQATDKAAQTEAEPGTAGQADWRWADPEGLEVNPAFRSLIPLQARGEYLALEESIRAEGCRDPLLVWKGRGVVLDGHTRRELCIKHKKPVKVREVELPDERAAVEYVLRVQRQRRNLTREAMSYLRGAEYNAVKGTHGGDRRGRGSKGQSDQSVATSVRLAEKYGVAEKTVRRDAAFARVVDRIVEEYGDQEVKRKLLGADVRLTRGAAKRLLKMPARERKQTVDELVEKGELPGGKEGAPPGRRPKEVARGLVARLRKQGEGHARSVLRQMARLLGMEVVGKGSEE